MIVVQALHALEEFAFEFWNVFPPMRAVYGGAALGPVVFVLFHASLISFGLWCYVREVRCRGRNTRGVVWLWVLIQGVTVALHVAWFLTDPGYQPGLATLPLFLPAIAMAVVALRREELSVPE